ncbi:leukocyte elastase inhibitor [Nephila pilipes]|uniref:Leukocyte elastase inhibitor n=1 Tax=Nephila pilipes TaxID=299642 RepID=A0A8X6R0U2_NEPPI|nr:leukocyte elastase inhibitor [Nephila pilipes]
MAFSLKFRKHLQARMIISSSMLLIAALVLCANVIAISDETCSAEDMIKGNLQKLAIANNHMALNLYKKLSADSTENLVFSPLSISLAFGMLFYGARGNSSKELSTVLGYKKAELKEALVHDTFNLLLNKLLRKESKEGYILQTANSILADRSLTLLPDFKREVAKLYKTFVFEEDFEKNATEVVRKVNSWVTDNTYGKINNLLNKLNPAANIVILNAMYFKGGWLVRFPEKNTRQGLFYNNGLLSEAKNVPMMHVRTRFRYAEMDGYNVLELPYRTRNITMLLLLPNELDGLPALEQSLTLEELFDAQISLFLTKVDVYLPRFKLEYSKELSEEMQGLGARSIFRSRSVDFSGMTPSKDVYVDEVIHKAMIEVNEMGSEATAVTGVATFRMSYIRDDIPEFRADHPFMLLLMANSRMYFFMARVTAL